jgi:hypothetical protein
MHTYYLKNRAAVRRRWAISKQNLPDILDPETEVRATIYAGIEAPNFIDALNDSLKNVRYSP